MPCWRKTFFKGDAKEAELAEWSRVVCVAAGRVKLEAEVPRGTGGAQLVHSNTTDSIR